ncbi:hypothetical protein SK128_018194, partial [Halocaridina rubra]
MYRSIEATETESNESIQWENFNLDDSPDGPPITTSKSIQEWPWKRGWDSHLSGAQWLQHLATIK